MKPDPQEPADLLNLLRQQLILAQVRIMELEDARDAQAPRAAELEQLLRAAQSLADRKLEECAHLERVLAEARSQAEKLAALHAQNAQNLAIARADADTRLAQRNETMRQLEAALARVNTELAAIRSTRSWRWTAWAARETRRMSTAPVLHGEIEGPRPLRAPGGKISLAGWCVLAGHDQAPPVRLATAAGTLAFFRACHAPMWPRCCPRNPRPRTPVSSSPAACPREPTTRALKRSCRTVPGACSNVLPSPSSPPPSPPRSMNPSLRAHSATA